MHHENSLMPSEQACCAATAEGRCCCCLVVYTVMRKPSVGWMTCVRIGWWVALCDLRCRGGRMCVCVRICAYYSIWMRQVLALQSLNYCMTNWGCWCCLKKQGFERQDGRVYCKKNVPKRGKGVSWRQVLVRLVEIKGGHRRDSQLVRQVEPATAFRRKATTRIAMANEGPTWMLAVKN